MLIVGAKGFAKEVLQILHELNDVKGLTFYDDVNHDVPDMLYGQFPVLKTSESVKAYFKSVDNRFTIGVGNPMIRKRLFDKFTALGGLLSTTTSNKSTIGSYDVTIGKGANILQNAIIANGVRVGEGCIIYYNTTLTHDVVVGDFVEISPSVLLLGRCQVGSYTQVGANATILPDIIVGKHVIIAAGAVVTKDVPDYCLVAGVPAVIKKTIKPQDT